MLRADFVSLPNLSGRIEAPSTFCHSRYLEGFFFLLSCSCLFFVLSMIQLTRIELVVLFWGLAVNYLCEETQQLRGHARAMNLVGAVSLLLELLDQVDEGGRLQEAPFQMLVRFPSM